MKLSSHLANRFLTDHSLFNEETDRDKAFDNADTEYAQSIVNKISKSIEEYDAEDDE